MKVCVVGSGGREHVLASVLSRDAEVIVTPGNPAMSRATGLDGAGAITVTDLPPEQIEADLFVIGPEAPLVDGLADRLREAGRLVFGPGAEGARLEGSKAYMKKLLAEARVPTAAHKVFESVDAALAHLDEVDPPYVIKTDGLAAGKGVLVTHDLEAARADVRAKLSGEAFGEAGRRIIIEEALVGTELSVLAVCDGTRAVALAPARDHKRVGDGDSGPNTGGMGAFSPVPGVTDEVVTQIMGSIILPTLATLRLRGIDYRGVLYAGLMLGPNGPRLIEFNVRFGDPEAQVVLPRITSSLTDLLASAAAGELGADPTFDSGAAVTVIAAAEGYPGTTRTGDVIAGHDAAIAVPGAAVFGAGVGADPAGELVTAGGRVLDVTGFGESLADARERAYAALAEISWPGMHHRSDIAADA